MSHLSNVDWTQVITAVISLLSAALGIIKAQQAAGHSADAQTAASVAATHADRVVAASVRPPS